MEFFEAFLLGLIEGVTEFLPISSTGHLLVFGNWLEINDEQNATFSIAIQSSTILAVISLYADKFKTKYFSLWLKVFIAFLPIAVLGLLLYDYIKLLFNPIVIGTMFIVGGIVFLVIEKIYSSNEPIAGLKNINLTQSIIIGLVQAFALIPGTSRAGASIIGGLCCQIERKTATEFSFLLALPVLLSAGTFEIYANHQSLTINDWQLLLIGFITSYVVAFFAMKVLISIINKFTFKPFAYYRIIVGSLILLFAL